MPKKQKLELTWIGKDKRPKLEPRILIEDPDKSYHAKERVSENDIFDNMLIHGDNLLALKALEQEYAGQVKCVYIDPPYNTGSAFESYNDGIEHSLWLSLMRERLVVLWNLLSKRNGVLLVSINDDEAHYLKVMCDELFGRDKFITSLVWHYEGNTDNQAKIINYHEYILVYSKSGEIDDPGVVDPNITEGSKLFKKEIRNTVVKNGPANPVSTILLPEGFPSSLNEGTLPARDNKWPKFDEDIIIRDGKLATPVKVSSGWASKKILLKFIENQFKPVIDTKGQLTSFEVSNTGAIEAVKKRKQDKGHFVSVLRGFGTTNQMRLLLEKLGIRFSFPKPVGLISYLIEAFTGPDDIVVDSFCGSGTTGHAVLDINRRTGSRRKFILIEVIRETVDQVTVPRLKSVITGNKDAALSAHGGGFRYYELGPSLIEEDKWGNPIISKEFDPPKLAQAMCKLEGFDYAPDPDTYWMQGRSSETDFIFVTSQTMTKAALAKLSDEVATFPVYGPLRVRRSVTLDSLSGLDVNRLPEWRPEAETQEAC